MKKYLPIIIAVVLIATGAGVILATRGDDPAPEQSQSTEQHNDGHSSDQSETDNSEAVTTDEIEIENFVYSPATVTVKKGTTVTWTNRDDVQHNVVFDDSGNGTVENGKLIGKDESVSFTFNEVGEFPYHCAPHPQMQATVIVTE